jgi:arylsulfatase A-like enzyme
VTQRRPNILFLVLDSVRARNMSCYGYERPTTPNIDRLAEEGTLFEQAVSVGCWTLPVHASLFTGSYPSAHGVKLAKDALPDGSPTLARRLGELGYRTACFSNNPYVSDATGLTQGFDSVEDLWRTTRLHGAERSKASAKLKQLERRGGAAEALARVARRAKRPQAMLTTWRRWRSRADSGARATRERIGEWLDRGSDDDPFFVFVNYMETHEGWKSHERYNPPHPYNRRFLPRRTTFWRVARMRHDSDLDILRGLYDGAVSYLDAQVGDLIGDLRARGVLDDTVVIVVSDHGDSLGENGHVGHRMYLYEPLVHVPLIVRHPGTFGAARVPRLVQLCDLHPTILALAGDAATEPTGFKSLVGADGAPVHEFAIAENTAPKSLDGVEMRMVRDERFKYISTSNGRTELYDLATDPGETTNLAGSDEAVELTMTERLGRWERSLEPAATDTEEAEYDEETMARLRGLGYVG